MPTTTYAYVKVSLMRYNRLIGVNMEFVLLLLILLFMIRAAAAALTTNLRLVVVFMLNRTIYICLCLLC